MSASWELAPLRELLEVQNGYAFDAKKFTAENGVPLIRIRDLKVGDGTETNYTGQFDRDYLVNSGDLLIGMDGEFRCHEWKGQPSLLNQRVCRLRNFKGNLEPRFLYYGINKYLEEIEDATSYTTVKHLSSKTILGIEFPHPPLPEQQRIVGKLDAAFAALTEAQAHVERNRANARELFESYLNGVFATDGSSNVELRVLGEIVDFEGGSQPPKSEFIYEPRAGYVRFLQIRDFKRDDKVTFIPIAKKNRTCEENDVLIGRYGASVGNILSGRAGAYNVALVKTKPSKAITRDYLYYYLLSRLFQDALKKVADRSAQDGFSKDDIYNFPVPLPSIAEQDILCKKFNEVLRESTELATTYQQKLTELAGLKKAVLGAAFRGEL
jgi:type I restriction enzyme S subunit